MDWLLQVLFYSWWYGGDNRTKAADASDRYIVPLLLLLAAGVLGTLLVYKSLG